MSHYYTNDEIESRPTVIHFDYQGHSIEFHSDRGVFSKDSVDFGSRTLLDTVNLEGVKSVLDVGCGYGALSISLKNKSVNQTPSIGNLSANLANQITGTLTDKFHNAGLPLEQAKLQAENITNTVLSDPKVGATMMGLKTQFDQKLNEAIGEYEDGKKIAGDIPAYLALGIGYSPVDAVRVNVGFHWFDDKNATSYNNRNKKLDRGTLEYNAGAEYDINKRFTVSAGWQCTSYGLSDEYMDDKSFVVGSNSAAIGGVYHINKKMDLNVAYFHTFYQHKKTSETVQLAADKSIVYNSDYTRNNNVFAVGLDINF